MVTFFLIKVEQIANKKYTVVCLTCENHGDTRNMSYQMVVVMHSNFRGGNAVSCPSDLFCAFM